MKNNQELEKEDYYGDETDDYDPVLPETDNKRWELDEEPVIQNLRYELQKRMNPTGVENVLSWLRISLGKNIALSNLDIEEINSFMRNELPAFNFELVQNAAAWDINDSSARIAVSRWVERTMYTQLKRAYQDGERKYRKDSYQYNEHYNHDEVNSSEIGGGFRLPFFSKKRQPRRYEEEREF